MGLCKRCGNLGPSYTGTGNPWIGLGEGNLGIALSTLEISSSRCLIVRKSCERQLVTQVRIVKHHHVPVPSCP